MMEPSTNSNSTDAAEEARRLGHEPNRLNIPFLWSTLAGLGVLLLLAMMLMAFFFDFLVSKRQPRKELPASLTEVQPLPVEPALNPNQKAEMQQIRTAEDKVLSTYAWVNKERGVARIPVKRAMELLIERGLPAPNSSPGSAEKNPDPKPSNGEAETK